jgi:hypothetical protein
MDNIPEMINKYGFPMVSAAGMGYFIYFVWVWATTEIKPVLSEASNTLVALIDRVRMLDNDLIRLNQKVNTVLHLRGRVIESERIIEERKVDNEAASKFKSAVVNENKNTAATGEHK